MRRHISDGRETRIEGHAWILGTHSGRFISTCTEGNEGRFVADLIRPNCEWDEVKIDLLLLPFEKERVMNIRVSPNRPRDCWYWGFDWDIVYSVKMAYAMLLCSEALATKPNIAARVEGEFSKCSFCNSFAESSLHLFRDCRVAWWVWEGLGVEGVMEEGGSGVRDWVEVCWKGTVESKYGKFMVGYWALWELRNTVVFEGSDIDPEKVVRRMMDVLEEGDGMGTVAEGDVVGIGVVSRDGNGAVLWGLSIVRNQNWDPSMGEAVAILDGLQEVAQRGHRNVEIESGCLMVVEAL
ncbi:uncharacterized protein LOC141648990 [Silene latifolia]|uniref:uncharacterized protein LOC141648990 n=1 Tax=Silene latifolia TaxID=37657 RepID=UPI003D7755EF